MDIAAALTPAALAVFGQVVLIDLVLAGDNAIVVGALAAGLPVRDRRRVILVGIIAAFLMRIGFALVATWLLQIIGLMLAGGVLLLWVSWKMWRDVRQPPHNENAAHLVQPRTFAAAAFQVAVADVSMSLDNVLAVAGAAREHPYIMVAGLVLSVAMMGLAANWIAGLIERFRWIAYIGLLTIVAVAGKMIWDGYHQVAPIAERMLIG